MKPLVKIIIVLAVVFASTFILIRISGILTEDDIKNWLDAATKLNSWYVVSVIVMILAIDIFIAVPTLTTCVLSGFFLGFIQGGLAASLGLILAGLIGYFLSKSFGEKILRIIINSEEKRNEAKKTFGQYGMAMIMLSRSSPIFPEVCACMAGISRMKFTRFILAWCVSSIPYSLIAAYSGSISSFENPKPAIYTIIGLYVILWISWFLFKKLRKKPQQFDC